MATPLPEHQPLAERLRPASLGEVIGQQHLLGEGMASVVHALDHGEQLHASGVVSAVIGALLSFGLWLVYFDRVKGHGEHHVADAAASRRMQLRVW